MFETLEHPNEVKDVFKIIHGDSLNMKMVEKNTVDLVITSPPYNLEKNYTGDTMEDNLVYSEYIYSFTRPWLHNCYRWLKDTGRICVNIPMEINTVKRYPITADFISHAISIGFTYHTTIVWNKNTVHNRTAWGSWKKASAPCILLPFESIIVFSKGEWKKKEQGEDDITADEFKKWVLGLWNFAPAKGSFMKHMAPFPNELPRRCMKLFSHVNDVVLDPFLGSGTTIIEGINNNRYVIGIEKEEKYIDVAKERIHNETNIFKARLSKT